MFVRKKGNEGYQRILRQVQLLDGPQHNMLHAYHFFMAVINSHCCIISGSKKRRMSLTDSAYKNRMKGKKMESKTLGYSLMSKTPNKDACREFAEEFHQSVLLSTQRKALHRGKYPAIIKVLIFS